MRPGRVCWLRCCPSWTVPRRWKPVGDAGGLSLIGVPTTVGFISKWYLILAALQHGATGYAIAALVLASSLLAVIYVWRVVEVAYFREPAANHEVTEAPLSMLLPLWALTIGCFYFGLETGYSVDIARAAAQSLLGVTP